MHSKYFKLKNSILLFNPVLQMPVFTQDDGYILALCALCIAILLLFGAFGRINMGFKVPGCTRPLSKNRKKLLKQYCSYYVALSLAQQRIFEHSVQYFIDSKLFITRGGAKISNRLKVRIATSATQLNTQLNDVKLPQYTKIILYPDDYYPSINRQYHKCRFNTRFDAIFISKVAFEQQADAGIKALKEAYNLMS